MEQLKFRGWNTDYTTQPLMEYFDLSDISKIERLHDKKLMQFTGLTDINGKGVFDGDIVSVSVNKKYTKEEAVVRYDMMGNEVICHIKTGEYDVIGKSLYEIVWLDMWCSFRGDFITHEPYSLGQTLGFGDLNLHKDNNCGKLNIEVIGNIYENPDIIKSLRDGKKII